jgi:hypothetical protein
MARISAIALQRALAEGRRGARRFDTTLTLRYAAMRSGESPLAGTGSSLNVSRTGLLFRSEGRPQAGDSIVVVLDWPVVGKNNDPLKLVITGVVVRTRRPFVAVSIYTHKLLPEQDLHQLPEVFWAPVGKQKPRRVSPRPLVLIEEDDTVALLISGIVTPQDWAVERADPLRAKALLARGELPIRLLVTRTPGLLESLAPNIPAILILDEGAPEDATGHMTGTPGRVTIRRPLTDVGLRVLIGILCDSAQPSAESSASGAVN